MLWPAAAGARSKYVEVAGNHLVLRPHNHAYPVEVMAMEPGKKVHDYLVGASATSELRPSRNNG